MPLYRVNFDRAEAVPVDPIRYASEGIRERQNLQKLIAKNLSCLGEDLFLVAESFKGLEGSLREVDILALDRDGNLVIIELKRTDGGEYADLQAIRYAAMLSSLTLEDVARIHAQATKKDLSDAEQAIRGFLRAGTTTPGITDRPRIFLVAPSFEKELAMTCLWLINATIDIRCIQAALYKIGDSYHIEIEQELPQPSAQPYQFRLRNKQIQREEAVTRSRRVARTRTLPLLEQAGVLKVDAFITMISPPTGAIPDPNVLRARYKGHFQKNVIWSNDAKEYSLSDLTRKIYSEYGGAGDPAYQDFQGPKYWALEGETISLSDKADALFARLNAEGEGEESDEGIIVP